ncbi:hypothetical protein FD754_020744, partial [Muntiacus muntjak]
GWGASVHLYVHVLVCTYMHFMRRMYTWKFGRIYSYNQIKIRCYPDFINCNSIYYSHYSSEKAAFLLSILAFVDMVARPSMGLVANTKWVRPRVQYFFAASIIANGMCHLAAPLSSTYVGLCIYAGFFGFAFGWLSSVLFETLMDLVGPQRFSSAVGLVTIVECCRLNDIYGDYKYTHWACGIILIVAGIYLFMDKAEQQQKKEGKEEETNVDAAEKPKEVTDAAEYPEHKATEGDPKEAESPV